jgi:nucleobase:cation symporter-1, NCS1 family
VNTAVSQASIDLPMPTAKPQHESPALIKPGYDPRLTNEDLAPLKRQTWGQYNIFAFWMSDVHSVGGYITAGSLFALGLSSWQVLVSLLVGIWIVCSSATWSPSPAR